MEYINIHVSVLDSREFLESAPADQSTWLKLLRYCVGQENGGRIAGAALWNDRQWRAVVRVSKREVTGKCSMWNFEADDLIVKFYPCDSEATLIAKRYAAALGNRTRHGTPIPDSVALRYAERFGVGVRNGREGKEREGKGSDALAHVPSLEECLLWAAQTGVAEDWVRKKHASTTETHGWVVNRQLIDWRHRWARFWSEDRDRWLKNNAALPFNGKGFTRTEPLTAPVSGPVDWKVMKGPA